MKKNITKLIPVVALSMIAVFAVGVQVAHSKVYKAVSEQTDMKTSSQDGEVLSAAGIMKAVSYPLRKGATGKLDREMFREDGVGELDREMLREDGVGEIDREMLREDWEGQIDKEMLQQNWQGYFFEQLDEEKIKASENLTEEQKANLIKANREAKVHWDIMKEIMDSNDKIYDEVMEGSESEYNEILRIYDMHKDIREKFENEEIRDTDENTYVQEQAELIKKSKVLGAEEKAILLADVEEVKQYQEKLDARYENFLQRTEENDEKFNKAYEAVEKIFADNNVDVNDIPRDLVLSMTDLLR